MTPQYTNTVGAIVQLNTGIDLTLVTTVQINVLQPNGSTAIWPGTIASIGGFNYYVQYTTMAGDLSQAGTYVVQPYVVFSNWSGLGEVATFTVYNPFDPGGG